MTEPGRITKAMIAIGRLQTIVRSDGTTRICARLRERERIVYCNGS